MLKPLFRVKRLLAGGEQKLFPAIPTHQHLVLEFHHAISLLGPVGNIDQTPRPAGVMGLTSFGWSSLASLEY